MPQEVLSNPLVKPRGGSGTGRNLGREELPENRVKQRKAGSRVFSSDRRGLAGRDRPAPRLQPQVDVCRAAHVHTPANGMAASWHRVPEKCQEPSCWLPRCRFLRHLSVIRACASLARLSLFSWQKHEETSGTQVKRVANLNIRKITTLTT